MQTSVIGLFWNLNKNVGAGRLVADLAANERAEIIVLAEVAGPRLPIAQAISSACGTDFAVDQYANGRVCIIHRVGALLPLYDDDVVAIRHIKHVNLLLVAAHLGSKCFLSREDQAVIAPLVVGEILKAELKVQHSRTLIVGDLNMDPFDPGMVQATGFHAVMCRSVVRRGARTINGSKYRFFFNPMWGLFGDAGGRAPGTWYGRQSAPVAYFWHMLDQILVRPDLVKNLSDSGVEILTRAGTNSLLSPKGHPTPSDHLPIRFTLQLS